MANFYFCRQCCIKDGEECINVESLNDIDKYFSKDNWIDLLGFYLTLILRL